MVRLTSGDQLPIPGQFEPRTYMASGGHEALELTCPDHAHGRWVFPVEEGLAPASVREFVDLHNFCATLPIVTNPRGTPQFSVGGAGVSQFQGVTFADIPPTTTFNAPPVARRRKPPAKSRRLPPSLLVHNVELQTVHITDPGSLR